MCRNMLIDYKTIPQTAVLVLVVEDSSVNTSVFLNNSFTNYYREKLNRRLQSCVVNTIINDFKESPRINVWFFCFCFF